MSVCFVADKSARRGGNLNANSRRSAIFIEYTVEFSHYLCLQSHCREIEPTCRTMLWERLKCDRRFAESPSACAILRHMTNYKDFVAIHFPIQRETQIRPAISSSLTNFPWYYTHDTEADTARVHHWQVPGSRYMQRIRYSVSRSKCK